MAYTIDFIDNLKPTMEGLGYVGCERPYELDQALVRVASDLKISPWLFEKWCYSKCGRYVAEHFEEEGLPDTRHLIKDLKRHFNPMTLSEVAGKELFGPVLPRKCKNCGHSNRPDLNQCQKESCGFMLDSKTDWEKFWS